MDNNTPMKLCPELMGLVKAGLKRVTIREGYRNLRPGPGFFQTPDGKEAIQVYITKVEHCELRRLSSEVLSLDGFDNHMDAVYGMKSFYPHICTLSEVTVIHFRK